MYERFTRDETALPQIHIIINKFIYLLLFIYFLWRVYD